VTPEATIMLLSPAQLRGRRGRLLIEGAGEFSLAERVRSREGAPLGEIMSFVSGLYFRGKASYAATFARAPGAAAAAFVMTAGGGLCGLDERVGLERLKGWSAVAIDAANPHFTAPLVRQASALSEALPNARFVLLGSVATDKYVAPLLEVFSERLLFPREFLGRGDMSRGALLLRAVREKSELEYDAVVSIRGAERPRPAGSSPPSAGDRDV
jgi:hypothetical protein